jgi:hypothetical protein
VLLHVLRATSTRAVRLPLTLLLYGGAHHDGPRPRTVRQLHPARAAHPSPSHCGIPGPLESRPALNCPRSSSFNEIENSRFPNGLPLIRGWPRSPRVLLQVSCVLPEARARHTPADAATGSWPVYTCGRLGVRSRDRQPTMTSNHADRDVNSRGT